MSQYRIIQCPQYVSSHVCYLPGGCHRHNTVTSSTKDVASTRATEIAERYVGQGGVLAPSPQQIQHEQWLFRPPSRALEEGASFYQLLMTNMPSDSIEDYSPLSPFSLSSYNYANKVAAPRPYSLGKYIYNRYHFDHPSFKYWTCYGIY